MPENSLILTADNSQLIQKLKEAQKATQDLTNTVTDGTKKQKDTVESLTKEWNKLYQEQKKGFHDVASLRDYEKRLADVKNRLKEVSDAEKQVATTSTEVGKKTDELGEAASGLGKKLGLVTLAIGAITAVSKAVIDAFKDTVGGLNIVTTAGEIWKQMAYNIATANFNMAQSFTLAIATAKAINAERVDDRKDLVENAKLRKEYNQLYFESNDRTKTDQERLAKINETMAKHNELIDNETKRIERQLVITELQLVNRPKSNKLLDEEAKLLARLQEIEGSRYSETKRLESQRTILEKEIHDKKIKAWYDEIEEQNKVYDKELQRQKEYQEASKRLIDRYNKSEIDVLKGQAKLDAIRDFGLKEIEELKKQLAALGPITKEQDAMFETLGMNVMKAYYSGIAKEIQINKGIERLVTPAILSTVPALSGIVTKDIKKAQDDINNQIKANKEFSIWDVFGIDPESDEGKKTIDAFNQVADTVKQTLDDFSKKNVENAQRNREILDQRVSEAEHALENETELYKAGYASNVTLKKKELDDIKKERDAALKKEREALKIQQEIDTAEQVSALITATAKIIKGYADLPVIGQILSIAAIAAMWGTFVAAKAKAAQITKLSEGGSGTETGMITGKKHSRGGERFLDNVEVENGEAWGVLSANSTRKYGKIFHEMVHSFNKGELPGLMSPTVIIDSKGSNKRLDAIRGELEKANTPKKEIIISGGVKIIKTGHNTRIIR